MLQLKERRKEKSKDEKLGWYKRYWNRNFVDAKRVNESEEDEKVLKKVCL